MSIGQHVIDAMVAAGASAEILAAAWKADLAEQEAKQARQVPWAQLIALAFERDGEVCQYCGTTSGPFELDHIVPRARGGENVLENVCVSCRSCNRAKRDRSGEEWEDLRIRRQKDRDRKRATRAFGKSAEVRGSPCDIADAPLSPDKSPPDPQKLTPNPAPTGRVIPVRAREKFAPPEGVADDQWKGFLQLRSAKRQPMTDRGYTLIIKKLTGLAEHGFPPGDMIDLAIERGWTTVHEPHDQGNDNGQRRTNGMGRHQPGDGLSATRRAANRVFGAPSASEPRPIP